MSTTMRVSHDLAGDVETVFALTTDPEFLKRKFEATGAQDVRVTCDPTPEGGAHLEITRRVTVDLPGFAAKVMQPTNTVVQKEDWAAPTADGQRVCNYRVDVQGVPSSIAGKVTLSPHNGKTRQEVVAEVKVSIPLLGGRLEKFAADSGKSVLAEEAAFTNTELSSR